MTYQTNPSVRIRGIDRKVLCTIFTVAAVSIFSLSLMFDFSDSAAFPVFFAVYSILLVTFACVLVEGLKFIPRFGTNLVVNGGESLQIGYLTYQFDEIDHLRVSNTEWHSVDFEITSSGKRRQVHLDLPETQSALVSFETFMIATKDQLGKNFDVSGSIVGEGDA